MAYYSELISRRRGTPVLLSTLKKQKRPNKYAANPVRIDGIISGGHFLLIFW
jgi:hypothetical protein